jgi:hypothetical protein
MGGEVDRFGGREPFPPRQVVVEEETEPDHPARAQAGDMGQHQADGPDQVRRLRHEDLAFAQRLAHEPEIIGLEIAQTAMDQLGGARGGAFREVALLGQGDGETAPGSVAGDSGAVDAAADDEEVVGV